MGSGKVFECKNCSETFMLMTGIGTRFPFEYREVVADIKQGKYGENFKKLMLSHDDAVVDLKRCLYVCDKCGN